MREFYETNNDLINEKIVIDFLIKYSNYKFVKSPSGYFFDYWAMKPEYTINPDNNKKVYDVKCGFGIEIKTRSFDIDKIEAPFISMKKIETFKKKYQIINGLLILVFCFKGEVFSYKLEIEKLNQQLETDIIIKERSGRTVRTRDEYDIEPMALILKDRLKYLGKI